MAKGKSSVKPVEVRWLIRSGRLSPISPIALIADRLKLRWLTMFDNEYVYGPTPGIVEVADILLRILRPRSVIDLFGGSGALSRLAIERGVKRVTYVDIHPDAAILNLKGVKGALRIVKEDAFNFLKKKVKCDLLFVDPPIELVDKVVKSLGELRNVFKKAALIWAGSSEDSMTRVKELRGRRMTTIVKAWGDAFIIVWKPGLRDQIEKVKYMLE